MHIELPDPHPGRCRNLRYVGAECLRCLDYDDTPHVCRFPEPPPSTTSVNYTIQTTSLSPWVAPDVQDRSGISWIDDTTEEWKPMNAKGKRHHVTCFHDEPGITVCTCGGCTCEDPPPHLAPCPRGPGGKYEIPFREMHGL